MYISAFDSSLCNLDDPNRSNPRSISSRPSHQQIGLDSKNYRRMLPLTPTGQQFETHSSTSLELYPAVDYERSSHRFAYHEQLPQSHPGFPCSSNLQPGPPHSSAQCHSSCHEMPQGRYGNLDNCGSQSSCLSSIVQADNDGDM